MRSTRKQNCCWRYLPDDFKMVFNRIKIIGKDLKSDYIVISTLDHDGKIIVVKTLLGTIHY